MSEVIHQVYYPLPHIVQDKSGITPKVVDQNERHTLPHWSLRNWHGPILASALPSSEILNQLFTAYDIFDYTHSLPGRYRMTVNHFGHPDLDVLQEEFASFQAVGGHLVFGNLESFIGIARKEAGKPGDILTADQIKQGVVSMVVGYDQNNEYDRAFLGDGSPTEDQINNNATVMVRFANAIERYARQSSGLRRVQITTLSPWPLLIGTTDTAKSIFLRRGNPQETVTRLLDGNGALRRWFDRIIAQGGTTGSEHDAEISELFKKGCVQYPEGRRIIVPSLLNL